MKRAVIFDMFETLVTQSATPPYFAAQMASDAGVSEDAFRALWAPSEEARTLGTLTVEAALEDVLRDLGQYSPDLLHTIAQRRREAKRAAFDALHPEILPLLRALRERGVLIGLLTNCYSEEAAVIRESVLFPFFDAPLLSCEAGLMKPDRAFFHKCLDALSVEPAQCLYVGDGGSQELPAARDLGLTALRACWYRDSDGETFPRLQTPLEILGYLE